MKLLNLYNRKVSISYKHSFCSFAALFVIVLTVFTIVMPFYVIFSINHDLWSSHNKIVYEQPTIHFQYKYILLTEHSSTSTTSYPITEEFPEETKTDVLGAPVNIQNMKPTKLMAWSSYDYFNQLMDNWQKSVSIKVKHCY